MAENTETGGTAKQAASNLEASLLAAGGVGLEFVGNGNNADMVSLIILEENSKYNVGTDVSSL